MTPKGSPSISFETDAGRRLKLSDTRGLISVFPIYGAGERWIVQEFSISGSGAIFTYVASSDVFFYEIKVSYSCFEYHMQGLIAFYVDSNRLPQPTQFDPGFPVGNGVQNMLPLHLHLREGQEFKIISWSGAITGKTPVTGIVHVRGAIV